MKRSIKILRRIVFFGVLSLIVWLLAIDGLVISRYAYAQHPEAIQRYGASSRTAVVFYTGVQSSGITHSAPLRNLWSSQGDVIVVEYNPKRFDARVTTYSVLTQLIEWKYERVLLIGASMGGLLTTDLIDLDRATGSRLKFAVVMQDVPQSKEDLRESDGAAAIALLAYPGPVDNWLLTDTVWRSWFKPPAEDALGTGADKTQLRAHHHISRHYPLSGWTGQVRYIVKHRGYERNQYVGIPLVVMESEHDAVVKSTAEKWKSVFGGGTVIQVPQTTHVGFVEYPDRWRAAFALAFAALPGW